jgi:hypothetical protein
MVIYLVIAAIIVFYVFPKVLGFYAEEKREREAIEEAAKLEQEIAEHTYNVNCFGGPCDGHKHQITMPERPHWYISPYLPTDDDGQPKEENRIGYLGEMHYFKPNIAFYQQMSEEDYFYVRDITESELHNLTTSGVVPSPEPPDEE